MRKHAIPWGITGRSALQEAIDAHPEPPIAEQDLRDLPSPLSFSVELKNLHWGTPTALRMSRTPGADKFGEACVILA